MPYSLRLLRSVVGRREPVGLPRAALERRSESVPGQACALDPNWKRRHPREHGELPQGFRRLAGGRPGDQTLEPLEQANGLGAGLSLDGTGHQRGRGPRDGAPGTFEAHIVDDLAVHPDPHRDFVAAQRVVARGLSVGFRYGAVVPRGAVVLQDDVLVQLIQAWHQANTARTRRRLRTSASTSSRVL